MQRTVYPVIGLGNPGTDYQETRHNAGFWFVQGLADRLGLSFSRPLFRSLAMARCPAVRLASLYPDLDFAEDADLVFVQPLCWMNRSGEVLPGLYQDWQRHDSLLATPWVAVDQMDLPPGELRLKARGGTAGHNGLKSVVSVLDTAFCPLYIGVGRPAEGVSVIDHVLAAPAPEDRERIDTALKRAERALAVYVSRGIEKALHACNSPAG